MRVGGTDSLLGIYQILAALEILVDWAHTTFRAWYLDNVLLQLP